MFGLDLKVIFNTNFYSNDLRSSSSGGQINQPINEKGKKFKYLEKNKVLVFNLDSLVALKIIPRPNYAKIDVDGNEMNIIKGMKDTLSNKKFVSLFIEINNFDSKYKYFKNFFSKFNLHPDDRYNNLTNHSSVREEEKQ